MERMWRDSQEPQLRDVFDDPIIQKRMASAGLNRDDLWRNIETVRRGLQDWKKKEAQSGRQLM